MLVRSAIKKIYTISIHALLAESDNTILDNAALTNSVFLSTLSLRRATEACMYYKTITKISIHALLAESDIWGTLINT